MVTDGIDAIVVLMYPCGIFWRIMLPELSNFFSKLCAKILR